MVRPEDGFLHAVVPRRDRRAGRPAPDVALGDVAAAQHRQRAEAHRALEQRCAGRCPRSSARCSMRGLWSMPPAGRNREDLGRMMAMGSVLQFAVVASWSSSIDRTAADHRDDASSARAARARHGRTRSRRSRPSQKKCTRRTFWKLPNSAKKNENCTGFHSVRPDSRISSPHSDDADVEQLLHGVVARGVGVIEPEAQRVLDVRDQLADAGSAAACVGSDRSRTRRSGTRGR